jgi:hypothetical protein
MFEWKRFFPKATSSQLERFERASGLSLPARYKNYLLSANGGQPGNAVCFTIPENGEEVMLGVLFGVSDEDDDSLSLDAVYSDSKDDIPAGFLPIGEDPGGNKLLLATSGDSSEGVFFWDRVGFLAKRTGKRLFFVSPNIEELLNSLQPIKGR